MGNNLKRQLDEVGFVILDDAMSRDLLDALRQRTAELYELEADRAGAEFKQEPGCLRLANLVDKGTVFETVISEPRVLEYVRHVLGPRLKLSSLNARTALPGSASQPLHVDMGAIPDEHGYWVCNCVWMLDDFTSDNGALRVIPGSHLWRQRPQDALADPSVPHHDEVLITGRAGSIIVINAHLWHGGLANHTAAPRSAVHAFYCRWDKPQQQHQKAMLRAEVQARLSPELRTLLALDDPLNDALARSAAPRSGFLDRAAPDGASAKDAGNDRLY
jgi:ectoine hydroxylase-related dioxygenase (phytanoyl-CoA dioxygenase family)